MESCDTQARQDVRIPAHYVIAHLSGSLIIVRDEGGMREREKGMSRGLATFIGTEIPAVLTLLRLYRTFFAASLLRHLVPLLLQASAASSRRRIVNKSNTGLGIGILSFLAEELRNFHVRHRCFWPREFAVVCPDC